MKNSDSFEKYLTRFVKAAKETIGENLLGVYLHGSAAMGCFNPKSSDLDLLVGVRAGLDDSTKRHFMDRVVELHEDFVRESGSNHAGIEMSVLLQKDCKPFIYPTPFDLHFSAMHLKWYKENPEDYILKMKGTDEDLAAHITITRARGRCLFGMPIENFFGAVPAENYFDSIRADVENAESEITENTTYLVLNLARVLAFKREGLVLSKAEGCYWALENIPSEYHGIVKAAFAEYESGVPGQYDEVEARQYARFMLNMIQIAAA